MSFSFTDFLVKAEGAVAGVARDAAGAVLGPIAKAPIGIIEGAAAKIKTSYQGVAGPLSMAQAAGALNSDVDDAGWKAKAAEIQRWQNVLNSRSRLEASRTPGSKMVKAVDVWNRTEAAGALSDLDDASSVNASIQAGLAAGVAPTAGTLSEYARASAAAVSSYNKAITYAQRINDQIDRDTRAAASTVTAYDVARVLPPVAVAEEAYRAASGQPGLYASAVSAASRAADVVEGAAAKAVGGLGDFTKYAPWVLGGLGLLYLLPLLPRPMHQNPARRRRRR